MSSGNALLWKIESDPAFPASYLFGTMHSAGPVSLEYTPRIEPFIRRCRAYYGETDIGRLMDVSMPVPRIQWNGLRSLLAPAAYDKASHFLKRRYGLDLDDWQHMPPLFLSALIHEKYLARTGGEPLDVRLWHFARREGLEMGGVEALERQHEIYKKIPIRVQLFQLKNQLKSLSASFRHLKKLEEAYANEDLSRLYKFSRRQLGGMRNLMFDQRNREMAGFILNILGERGQASFFAIGAAHLPGSKGILRKLKAGGLTLRPISLPK